MPVVRTRVVSIIRERYDVYIGRCGHYRDGTFGNPFDSAIYGRLVSIELYKSYLYRFAELDLDFRRRLLELEGKILGCPGNCKPERQCHGDVIIEWLEDHRRACVGQSAKSSNP